MEYPKTMKALVAYSRTDYRYVEDFPVPELGPDDILIKTWVYGDEIKKWAKNGYIATGEDKTGNLVVSKHASKRIHERMGIGKKAQLSLAKKAFEEGIREETVKERLVKTHIGHVKGNSKKDSHVRLYHDKVFIFSPAEQDKEKLVLVSVIPLPENIRKYVA